MKGVPYTYIFTIIVFIIVIFYTYKNTNKNPINRELYTIPFHIERKSKDAPRVVSDVPLAIYQTWHSNDVSTKMRETIYSLLEMNPEFDYYLYSDEACRKFIQNNFNEDVLKAFDTLKPGAYKSDLWRYCILYKLGGVYLDIKYYSIEPLINIIETNSTIFVKDRASTCTNIKSNPTYNAFIVSPPNNVIFKDCIYSIVDSCKSKSYNSGMFGVTGPCLLSKMIEKNLSSDYIKNSKFKFYRYRTYVILGKEMETIYYDNKLIICAYEEYRSELGIFERLPHYSIFWNNRDIYNSD